MTQQMGKDKLLNNNEECKEHNSVKELGRILPRRFREYFQSYKIDRNLPTEDLNN